MLQVARPGLHLINTTFIAPFIGTVVVNLEDVSALKQLVHLPHLLSNTLVVYRVTPRHTSTCKGKLLSITSLDLMLTTSIRRLDAPAS